MSNVQKVKELRDRTGLGVLEAVRYLAAAEGDIEKAIDLTNTISSRMRARGAKPSQGVIVSHVIEDGRRGVMVELLCETDFAAKTDVFKEGAQLIAQGMAVGAPETNTDKIINNLSIMLRESVRLGRCEVFDMRD